MFLKNQALMETLTFIHFFDFRDLYSAPQGSGRHNLYLASYFVKHFIVSFKDMISQIRPTYGLSHKAENLLQ